MNEMASRLQITMRDPLQEASALSGGNQQKILLARVLAQNPSVLLMYDATRGVDVGTKAEIYELMRDQCAKGVGILFYSTDVANSRTSPIVSSSCTTARCAPISRGRVERASNRCRCRRWSEG